VICYNRGVKEKERKLRKHQRFFIKLNKNKKRREFPAVFQTQEDKWRIFII